MRLVVFDVDGTLIDSQHHIFRAMSLAFETAGLLPRPQPEVLGIVGLSLPVAVAQLAPEADPQTRARIVTGYRAAYMMARLTDEAPLYPGALACLDALALRDDILLALATGKSRRGVAAMIEAHGLQGRFVSLQTADDHPSKPDPAMLLAAISEAGVSAGRTAMVGDTSFDMEMAVAAGVTALGVSWGYHSDAALRAAGAALVADNFGGLCGALDEWAQ